MNATTDTIDLRLIGSWLGLPPGNWPPDHYTLLGLAQGESDLGRIEQHVHERLARVRCFQIAHPTAATEVMNRLAQAFLCLSDAGTRKAYESTLNGQTCKEPPIRNPAVTIKTAALKKATHPPKIDPKLTDTSPNTPAPTSVDWQAAPPPVRHPPTAAQTMLQSSSDETVIVPPMRSKDEQSSSVDSGISLVVASPADLTLDIGHVSQAARRGLGTPRKIYERVLITRQLLQAWMRVGRYLGKSKRQLTKPSEESDLTRQLATIDDLLPDFPRIMGRPGQPGYRVASMARLETGVLLFRAMDPDQRESLAKDWRAGHRLLLSHQKYLRQEIKNLKRQSWLGKGLRALQAGLQEHRFWIILGLFAASLLLLAWVMAFRR